MNIEHLNLVYKYITEHPESWNQRRWHFGTAHYISGWAQILAGHEACDDTAKRDIAGWAQILAGHEACDDTAKRDAQAFLELSPYEASVLFSARATLDQLRAAVDGTFYDREGFDRYGCNRYGYNREGSDCDRLDAHYKCKSMTP